MIKARMLVLAGPIALFGIFAARQESMYAGKTTTQWVKQLEEGNDQSRQSAAEAIGSIGPEAALTVVQEMGHPDVRVREAALVACDRVVAECLEIFQTLSCCGSKENSRVLPADTAMREIGIALISALEDESPQIRSSAARIFPSVRLIWDPDDKVLLARASQRLSEGAKADLAGSTPFIEALGALRHAKAVPALVEIAGLSADHPELSPALGSAIVTAIGSAIDLEDRATARSVIPLIVATMETEKRKITAIAVLRKVGGAPVVKPLLEVLDDQSGQVRETAAWALDLVTRDDPELGATVSAEMPRLVQLLGDPVPGVSVRIAALLQQLGPSAVAAAPALVRCLESSNRDVRISASDTLAAIGCDFPGAREALERLAESDKDSEVRKGARGALARIQSFQSKGKRNAKG